MTAASDSESVARLEDEIRLLRDRLARDDKELRMAALRSGSRGVAGGLLLMLLILIVCGLFRMAGVTVLSGDQLVMIAGILAAALLTYFGFILNFALKVKTTWEGVDISSHHIGEK